MQGRRDILNEYEDKIEEIYEEWAQDTVDHFVHQLLQDLSLRQFSLEEIKSKFQEVNFTAPTERDSRILAERYDEISERIRKETERRGEEYRLNPLGTSGIRNLVPVFHSIYDKETHNRQIETINRTGEKIQGEQNQISILENLKHQYEEELKAVSYPLYEIGFLSQVIFVITGVVVPLNYEWWAPIILFSPMEPNLFGLLMFYVGLASSFSYIGLELWHSLYKRNKN